MRQRSNETLGEIDVMNHTILIGIWHAYEFNQTKQWVRTCGP